ncbi:MAG: S1/P1 nuclease [Bacteroidales bacterium]|nr:S1/P1 nuclease [Bacteroidales bacterium]
MRKIYILILTTIFLGLSHSAWAWGQEGHRIIGEIAYQHLSKKARKQVDKIMGEHGLVYWANWPDAIKSDTIYPTSYDWHFQDLDAGMSDSAVVAALTHYPTAGGNLFRKMDSLILALRNNPNDMDALRFVVHLMGDRFCPMHTAHMDDLGGNTVSVSWHRQQRNLHWVWDEGLILARGYSYSEYAEYLEDHFKNQKNAISQMSIEEITLRNYHFCNEIYDYQSSWDNNAYHYVYHFAEGMEWQLYASGIRLAMLLNEIYG